jgi:dihydrofolate reductase
LSASGSLPVKSAPEIFFVIAVAEDRVIGRDNAMPWKLRTDMKRLVALTRGKPVIMGRKTYLSIGKPLKDRTTIVVTRQRDFSAPGIVVAPSLEAAIDVARGDAMRRFAAEIAVLGGADIYMQLLHRAHRIELTEVHARPGGDTHFPKLGPEWHEVARERHEAGEGDSAAYSFVTYRRNAA